MGKMSWISIVLILICIAAARSGYRRGFTKTVISMLSFWIIILLVSILNPMISNAVDGNTDLGEKTKKYCTEIITERFVNEKEPDRQEQIDMIESIPMPEWIKEELLENNNQVIYNILDTTDFFDYIAVFCSKLILRALVLLSSIVLAWMIVKIAGVCIEGIVQMPGLNLLNRIAGVFAGLIKGLVCIWVLFMVISFTSGTGVGGFLANQIQQDLLGNMLYQYNPFVWLLVVFFVL